MAMAAGMVSGYLRNIDMELSARLKNNADAVLPVIRARHIPAFAIRSVSFGYSSYHTKAFSEAERRWSRRSRLGWTKSAVFEQPIA